MQVFEQKLDNPEAKGSFTRPLAAEEECLVAQKVLDGDSRFEKFLKRYQEHYPLCNEAIETFLQKLTEDAPRRIVAEEFKRYGYNEEQGMAVCRAASLLDGEFLFDFCKNSRIFFANIYSRLALIRLQDFPELCAARKLSPKSDFGEIYQSACKAR